MSGQGQGGIVLAGHRFTLAADLAGQDAHARAFTAAHPAPSCGHHTAVTVHHGAASHARITACLAAAPSEPVTPFRGEPYYRARLGDTVWWYPDPASHLKADHLYGRGPAGDLIVVLHPGAERGERYAMRAVRERVLRCAEDRGWTLFHAASVALDDAGVLVAGGAGAGKTTVALALAAHRAARLVAADRAAVTGDCEQVVGMPLSYRIAAGTAAALPPHTGLHPTGEPASAVPGFGGGRKASFTPDALAAALRTGVRESGPLRLVVLPRLSDDDRPPAVTRLDPARARPLLAAACCTPDDEDWLEAWFTGRAHAPGVLRTRSAGLLDDLSERVAVIGLSAGVRTPRLLETLADLVTGSLP